jgi:hypothetical protein
MSLWNDIYWIGFFVSYFNVRRYLKRQGEWNWMAFAIAVTLSLTSWICSLMALVIYFLSRYPIKSEPPKWL